MRLDELFRTDEEAGVGLIIPGVNTTKDVGQSAIQTQAAKLGIKVNKNGVPPIARTNGQDALRENNQSPLSFPGTKAWRKAVRDAMPGTPEWFKVWFTRPYLTNGRAVNEGRKRKKKSKTTPYYGVWWGSRDEDVSSDGE